MRLPRRMVRALSRRLLRVARSRPPDVRIGGQADPYLERWWLLPRNRWCNVYLHLMHRSDDDRALHDHPWINCSILLAGGYLEVVTGRVPRLRRPGAVVLRRSTALHRLELMESVGEETWSLFVTGPRVRIWGFQCRRGWIPWTEFVDPDDPGAPGPGCPE